MIIAALSLALAQAAAAPGVPEEIVVTARRLKEWRGKASANERGSRCRTVKSTGDRALDQLACDSMRWCMGTLSAQAAALGEKNISRQIREQRTAALNQSLTACVEEQHQRRLADLVERRATARIERARN